MLLLWWLMGVVFGMTWTQVGQWAVIHHAVLSFVNHVLISLVLLMFQPSSSIWANVLAIGLAIELGFMALFFAVEFREVLRSVWRFVRPSRS